jgi:hypothetical protein
MFLGEAAQEGSEGVEPREKKRKKKTNKKKEQKQEKEQEAEQGLSISPSLFPLCLSVFACECTPPGLQTSRFY